MRYLTTANLGIHVFSNAFGFCTYYVIILLPISW